jgi:hypothetical protein
MMLKPKKLVALIAAVTTVGALSAIPAFAEDMPVEAGQNTGTLTFTVTTKDGDSTSNSSFKTFKIGEDGNLYDEDGNKIESDFKYGSEDGVDACYSVTAAYTLDENGNVYDENGDKVEPSSVKNQDPATPENISGSVRAAYTVDEDGNVYDENGDKVEIPEKGGFADFTKKSYTVDENGNVYDEDGNKVN